MRFVPTMTCLLVLCCAWVDAATPRVRLSPESPAPGEVFRVEVHGVGPADAVVATFEGVDFLLWQLDDQGWEGLVAVDRDRPPGPAGLQLGGRLDGRDRALASIELTVALREYPEQHLRVQQGMVDLSAEDQARAAQENRRIRKTLGRRSPERLWRSSFALPLRGPITSTFGVRRVYNGTPKSYHSGLDIAAPLGTPVSAAGAGNVALVGDYFYTGKTVFLDHGLGLYTAYFHLDAVLVEEGKVVTAGEELGRVGSSGRSTGPHLHWGVYLSGRKADPLSLLHAFGAAGDGESP